MGQTAFFKKLVCPVFLLALLVFPGFSALFALQVPPQAEGYVTDRAALLSPSARERLEAVLRAFDEKTSNQLVVATFPSLEGDSLEDFSMRLAETWKAGQKKKDNGVILLIFKKERKIRIEVGYGLEGVLTDALSGQIIGQVIAPYFRKEDYAGGILAGTEAIMQATQGEFKGTPKEKPPNDIMNMFVILGIFFLFHLWASSSRLTGRRRGGYFGFFPMGGGGYGGGGGGFGGFSGGGGSFGGGGASGGW